MHFKLRHMLIALMGLMAIISLVALGWNGYLAMQASRDAAWLAKANRLADAALRTGTTMAMEQGVTVAVLSAPDKATDEMRDSMQQLRESGDRYLRKLQQLADAFMEQAAHPLMAEQLQGMKRHYAEVLAARRAVDAALRGEGAMDEQQWLRASSGFLRAVSAVRRITFAPRQVRDFVQQESPLVKEALYTAAEYAVRERTLVGMSIASGHPLTEAQMTQLRHYRGIVDEALHKLDYTLPGWDAAGDVMRAHQLLDREFRGRFQQVREAVFAASEAGESYPLTPAEWYQEATRGIDSIIRLSEATNKLANEQMASMQRSVAIGLAVLATAAIVVIAVLLVTARMIYTRGIQPLYRLECATEAIAAGHLDSPVEVNSNDELGSAARSFERMRLRLQEEFNQRERTESYLREEHEFVRAIFDTTRSLIVVLDLEGRIVRFNRACESLTGYSADEVLGKVLWDFLVPPEQREGVNEVFFSSVLGGVFSSYENDWLTRNGERRRIAWHNASLVGSDGKYVIATGMDITERKEIERRLRQSERRFRELVETTHDWMWEVDAEGRYTYASPQVKSLLGYRPEELVGKTPFDVMPKEEAERVRDEFEKRVAAREPLEALENLCLHRDGHVVYLETSAVPIIADNGALLGYRGSDRDITARRLAEAQAQKMSRVVEQTADVVIITDRRGMIEYVNQAFEDVTGYTRAEVLGKPASILKSGTQDAEFYKRMWELLSAGKVFRSLLTNRRKDGELFYEEIAITPLRDAFGEITHYVSTGKDVTARRHAEMQLQQSEKLASIGQLAAGVAHEINNPVGYISSNLGTLTNYVADLFTLLDAYEQHMHDIGEEAQEAIEKVRQEVEINYLREDVTELLQESQEGVKRVKQIVQDLKDFSRADEGERQWTNLHKELMTTLNIVHNELKYKAEVVREFGDIPEVDCVPSQLNQVFLNLLVNAAQAIEQHGVITVRTGTQDEQVWVEVEDTGCGMDEMQKKKIFEPFYTTKPVGKGTGLGLSLSFGIVERHHGRIEVDSEPGKGSRFRIWLPVCQPEEVEEEPAL